jgi:ADP-ribosylglycohydrolase
LSTPSIETAALKRRVLAGQPGSAGELAIAAGRSLIDFASDRESLRRVYADWARSSPAEPDRAIVSAAGGEPLAENLSAIALSRVTPLAIWGHAADALILAAAVRTDTALTHPAPIAGDAAAVLALIMQALLQGRDASDAVAYGHAFARQTGCAREVIATIVESSEPPKTIRGAPETPSVLSALQAALFHLTRSGSFEEALQWALATGSYSDALPTCVGSVMGARFGREGIPQRLRTLVLSSRAMEGLPTPPRPSTYWGTDAMAMAEALLTSR